MPYRPDINQMPAQAATYPRNLAFFAGGDALPLRAVTFAIEQGKLHSKIRLIVSNHPESAAIEWAHEAGIPTLLISGMDETDDAPCLEALARHEIDLVLLAGYLRKVHPPIVEKFYPRIWNLHPALLPKYGGLGMYGKHVHRAVLESGDRRTGATLHRVDYDYDTGPILLQSSIGIREHEPIEMLAKRVSVLECVLLVSALSHMERGEMEI